jgi:hypothetical protein
MLRMLLGSSLVLVLLASHEFAQPQDLRQEVAFVTVGGRPAGYGRGYIGTVWVVLACRLALWSFWPQLRRPYETHLSDS